MVDESYVSTSEAATELGVTRQRVLQLIERGKLDAKKFANVYMIRRADLALVEDRPVGRPPKAKPEPSNGKKKGGK